MLCRCHAPKIIEDVVPKVYLVVPERVRPGEEFSLKLKEHELVFRCPENLPEDRKMEFGITKVSCYKYRVPVPPNSSPCDVFNTTILGSTMSLLCPVNRVPTVTVIITASNFPVHQQELMFDVEIPGGIKALKENRKPCVVRIDILEIPVCVQLRVSSNNILRIVLPLRLPQLPEYTTSAIPGIIQDPNPSRITFRDSERWVRGLVSDELLKWAYLPGISNTVLTTSYSALDISKHAYVRRLAPLHLVPADRYVLSTSITTTEPPFNISTVEIARIARRPFNEKVAWFQQMTRRLAISWEDGRIYIRAHRDTLLQESLVAINKLKAKDMRRVFVFRFSGEEGIDAGGLAREWFSQMSKLLLHPDYGLFLTSNNQNYVSINPASALVNEDHLQYYYLVGRFVGKALFDSQIISLRFVPLIYKHMLGWPITFNDIQNLDADIFRTMLSLLDVEDVKDMSLTFEITEAAFGTHKSIEIVENGSTIDVTNDNLGHYLGSQLRHRALDSIKEQLEEFLTGLYEVVPEPLLAVFELHELELLLHGQPGIDVAEWRRFTRYTGEVRGEGDQVVQWFWEIVSNYTYEDKIKLLLFCTGTDGVPALGFEFLQGNGSIQHFTINGLSTDNPLPHSHTCFNRIDLPMYTSKDDAVRFITMAIRGSRGYGRE